MRHALSVTLCCIAIGALAPSLARAGSGFYLSSDLGANFASSLNLDGTAYDGPSDCDEFINPLAPSLPECATQGLSEWVNDMGTAEGILAGVTAGYSLRHKFPDQLLGGVRLELEYFYRDSEYNQTSALAGTGGSTPAKLGGELLKAEDRVGSVTSHNLFGNLYYDFFNTSRFTPYIGFGFGVGFTDMDYGSLWARNPDPAAITTGQGRSNAAVIRRNLAGTTSSLQDELNDTLFGYQVLFGVDYALTESLSLGVKGRWVNFDSFNDRVVWDPLRSHPPNRRRDGSQPVSGRLKTDDIEMFGVSLSLKYHF